MKTIKNELIDFSLFQKVKDQNIAEFEQTTGEKVKFDRFGEIINRNYWKFIKNKENEI